MAQGEDIVDFGIQKTVSVEQNTTQKEVYIHKHIKNFFFKFQYMKQLYMQFC